ncbi:hypothetical protein [Parapedobacter sp. 10938]|uniref:hypothetical protein n=1 Tax=Parapedobacter flavus TaxID=3110225 RepID=UPI002DBBEF61|nr:hypothetical protein [Parapedobacter sp. 10938]MEC3879131.1 hypothetical protein [Parapedobacter sp. 10938]
MIQYTLTFLVEIACLITAWRYLRHEKELHWALQPWYLLIVVITEGLGGYIGIVQHKNNAWLYNIFLLIEGTFISYFIYRICKPYGLHIRYWLLWLALFILFFSIEQTAVEKPASLHFWTVIWISASFVVATIYYIYLLFNAPLQPVPLRRHASSLWMGAISCFYFGSFVTMLLAQPLIATQVELAGLPLYALVYLLLNLMLYGLWMITFTYRYRNLR